MADDDQVTVTLEPDLFAGGTEGTTEQKGEPQKNGHDTTKVVEPSEDLRAQAEEARGQAERDRQRAVDADRRRVAAEQETIRAREDAAGARSEAIESQVSTVESGIAAAQAEAESAEREYATAFAEGDAVKSAAAQRKIARAEARIARLDEAKDDLAARKVKAPETEERRELPQQAPADPVEAYVQGRTEPTANWLRAHPEWVTDSKKNAKLTAAHYDAAGEGIAVDSPEYFEHVEKFIGLKTNGAAQPVNGQQPRQRKQGAPVAPGASTGGGMNGGAREVVLTRGEANAATDGTHVWNYDDPSPQKKFRKGDVIGVQEFARRKLEMTKQGAYDRTYVEQ